MLNPILRSMYDQRVVEVMEPIAEKAKSRKCQVLVSGTNQQLGIKTPRAFYTDDDEIDGDLIDSVCDVICADPQLRMSDDYHLPVILMLEDLRKNSEVLTLWV